MARGAQDATGPFTVAAHSTSSITPRANFDFLFPFGFLLHRFNTHSTFMRNDYYIFAHEWVMVFEFVTSIDMIDFEARLQK